MNFQLLTFLVFGLLGIGFVIGTVSLISRLVRPKVNDVIKEPAKGETYECGEPAIGSSWVRFDIRFYTLALVFLIFDVEVTFLYPWALIFKELREAGMGLFLFVEVFLFLVILMVGFAYCWCRGDLDWIKSVATQTSGQTSGEAGRSNSATPQKELAKAAAE